jgi:hypothetical protein
VKDYLWLVFLLIIVFLLVNNSQQAKAIINSLATGQIKTIVALQGGNPGKVTNAVGS